jgi:predicted MFS family arabinose efflux permease
MRSEPWKLALGGMIAMAAGMGVGRFVYTPILPVMVEELSLTASQAGLLASANFLGYLAGALLAAIGRFGHMQRGLLLTGLAVNAAGLAAMALTGNFVVHLATRFIGGFASAFIFVFASALVIERLAEMRRSSLSALHFGGVGLGIFVSALMVTAMMSSGADWRALWSMCAVLAVAGLAGAAILIPRGSQPAGAPDLKQGRPGNGALRFLILSYGLFGFSYIITATFIVAIVRGAPEIRVMEPYVWAIVGLAAMPSIAFWIMVSRWLSLLEAYALACLVEAVGVAASVLSDSIAGVFVAAVFLGGTMMGITALGLMAARTLSDGDPRVNLALMTASFGLGQVAGPIFAGYMADAAGSYLVPSLIGSGALIAASGMAYALHYGRQR